MPRKLRALSWLHRSQGLFAALFIIVIAATGLLLNHTDDLRLEQRYLHAPWLLRRYGISAPEFVVAFPVGERWVSQWGRDVFLDAKPLAAPPTSRLLGAWRLGDLLVVAADEQTGLFTPDGQPVDVLRYPGDRRARQAGVHGSHLVVELEPGERYAVDATLTSFSPLQETGDAYDAARPADLPHALRVQIQRHFAGEGIAMERVVLDLHSGRLFGRFGVFLVDAVAIIVLLLAPSGIAIVWLRQRRKVMRGR